MTTHEHRSKVVQQWLRERFHDRGSPPFEHNERTISILYDLATCNQQQTELADAVIEDLKFKVREYQAQSQRYKNVLKQSQLFHLPTSMLNNTHNSLNMSSVSASFNNSSIMNNTSIISATTATVTRPIVRALAELANVLELSDTRLSSYVVSINDLMNEHDRIADKRIHVSQSAKQLAQKTLNVMERLQYLKQLLAEFQAEQDRRDGEKIVEQRKRNVAYMTGKAQEYEQELTQLQNQIQDVLLDARLKSLDDVQHGALVKRYQRVLEMREKLVPRVQKLASYHNLPPDLESVKFHIAQTKKELNELDEKFKRRAQDSWFE